MAKKVVVYFFYKNLAFTLTQFWFTLYTGFSGQRFYDDWFQSLYNVLFTALPVIVVGIFDKDVSASRSKACPQLYKAGIDNLYFKWRVIVVWLIAATFQSLIFFFLPITCAQFPQNNPGRMLGVWDVSTMAYTCILITVNLRLMMASSSLTKWHHIICGWQHCCMVCLYIYLLWGANFIYTGEHLLGDLHLDEHLVFLVHYHFGSTCGLVRRPTFHGCSGMVFPI